MTIKDHLDDCMAYLRTHRNYRPNTEVSFVSRLSVIDQWLEDNNLPFNETGFEKFLTHCREKEYKASYIEAFILNTSVFLQYLISLKLLDRNWTKDFQLPKRVNKQPQVLTSEETKAIIACPVAGAHHCYKETFTLFWLSLLTLMAETGCRVGECVNLKLEDLNLAEKYMSLKQTKTGEARLVPLADNVVDLLTRYLKLRNKKLPEEYLFTSVLCPKTQTPISKRLVGNELKRRALKIGLKKNVYPHLLRHSFITQLLKDKYDIKTVAQIVGHRDIRMTGNVYSHLQVSDLSEAVNKNSISSNEKKVSQEERIEKMEKMLKALCLKFNLKYQ